MASNPTPAAFSRPIMILFLVGFLFNLGSGLGLWWVKSHFWRVLHGWSIPPFLIIFGVVWRVHILRGWQLKKNILSGVITLLIFIILTATGWMIYYSGSDDVQRISAQVHTWLGIAISVVLFAHAVLGWRTREPATPVDVSGNI